MMTTNENGAFALQSALLRDRELAQKISDYIYLDSRRYDSDAGDSL